MSIADKLTTIAQNQQRVYDAGYAKGQAEGGDGGYDEGYNQGVAEVEARNAEILTDCNTQLENKGVESAESLAQVPERIEEIKAEPMWVKHMMTGSGLFYNAKFPENTELVLEYQDIGGSFDTCARQAENMKKFTLICENPNPNTTNGTVSMVHLCSVNPMLEVVDLSRFQPKIHNLTSAFSSNPKLREIIGEIDYSLCTHLTNTFSLDTALEEIRVKAGSIKTTFYINASANLTDATIQSIIDGLADLTGQTAQTLSLHASVGAKLTEEQKATITAKNWTLVY